MRQHRLGTTPVVLGRDVGRPGQTLRVLQLQALVPEDVDMRTMVLIGSSTTVAFDRPGQQPWVYTPRWYGHKP
ncbi:Precorrin-3B C(17)-methyltransferase [compost metagenome]